MLLLLASGGALLVVLGILIGVRCRREYRIRNAPKRLTVALVWGFYAVHFGLYAMALAWPTWRFELPLALALAAGGLLALAGIFIHLSAVAAFASVRRMSGLKTGRLVTHGIYRWSRNPQVVGWSMVLLGLGIWRMSWTALLLAVIFWGSYWLFLPLEEALLARLYGEAYTRYKRDTHRFFGLPGRGRN